METLKNLLKSRMVVLNGAAALVMGTPVVLELVPFLTDSMPLLINFDWTQFVSTKQASEIVLVLNLLNVYLRLKTTGPVGAPKDE
jgi:hypothetical protein